MTTYTVHFRTDAGRASHDIEADTPEEALALACKLDPRQELSFDPCYSPMPVNEIAVCDSDGEEVAIWLDDDRRLRLAAQDLLEALEAVCDLPADDSGDRTVPAGFLDQARAAIAKAKGGSA
jgi:hypothetical protein